MLCIPLDRKEQFIHVYMKNENNQGSLQGWCVWPGSPQRDVNVQENLPCCYGVGDRVLTSQHVVDCQADWFPSWAPENYLLKPLGVRWGTLEEQVLQGLAAVARSSIWRNWWRRLGHPGIWKVPWKESRCHSETLATDAWLQCSIPDRHWGCSVI